MDWVLDFGIDRPALSIGWPITLKMRPSVAGPTGTRIGCAGVDRVGAAAQPVGRRHGDGAHPVVAEVLLNFEDDAARQAFALGRSSAL